MQEYLKFCFILQPAEDGEPKEGETSEGEPQSAVAAEEELKEMTLDEWKAQRQATRTKPQYNLRKAGEGEDSKQWKTMVALDKKKVKLELKLKPLEFFKLKFVF